MGSQCSCLDYQTDQNQVEVTDNNQSVQNDDGQNNQYIQDNQKASQGSDDGIAQEQIQKMNSFQLDSYEIEDHLPKNEENYAVELQRKDLIFFEVAQAIKNQLSKNKKLEIRYFSENYKRIPSSEKLYKLQNNDIYVGQWVKGRPFGIGSLFQNFNGTMYLKLYQGQLENGIPQGYGIMMWEDGSNYRGNFKDGLCEGHGILKKFGQFVYEGDWKKNLPDGKGYERWFNRNKYTGHYLEGKKHGKGRQTWVIKKKKVNELEINEVYDGDFVDNLFDGDGKYEWPDGREYNGKWKQGKMHGYGVFKWSDGRTYKGNYKYDYKHGKGQFNWPDGKQINGNWVAGKLDGDFQLSIKNQDQIKVYQGTFQKGSQIKWQNNSNNSYAGSIRSLNNSQLIPNELANTSHKNQFQRDVIQELQPDLRQQNDINDKSEFFKKLELKNILKQQNANKNNKYDGYNESRDQSKQQISSIDDQVKFLNEQSQDKSKQQILQPNDQIKIIDDSQNKSNQQVNQSNDQLKIDVNYQQNQFKNNQSNDQIKEAIQSQNQSKQQIDQSNDQIKVVIGSINVSKQQFNLSNDFSKVLNESQEKSKQIINQSSDTIKVINESKVRSNYQIHQSNDQIKSNQSKQLINQSNDQQWKVVQQISEQFYVNNENYSDQHQTPFVIYQFDESKQPSKQQSRNFVDNQIDRNKINSNHEDKIEQQNIFQRKNSSNHINQQ